MRASHIFLAEQEIDNLRPIAEALPSQEPDRQGGYLKDLPEKGLPYFRA